MMTPLYKSPDNFQKHLALSVRRGVQGGGSGRKGQEKAALNPYECACFLRLGFRYVSKSENRA